MVAYSNQAKSDLLGVDPALIERHGAVSPEVAEAMADGALERFRADVGVSITGIAGPEGGTKEKPVGYVCFCAKLADGRSLARDPVIPGAAPGHPRALRPGRDAHVAGPARRRGGSALSASALEPFEVRVAEPVLDDLRSRLGRTRWPEQPADKAWELGVDIAYLRELCGHWAGGYDWRTFESRLNELRNHRWKGIHLIWQEGDGDACR